MNTISIYYDGLCPLCSREIDHYRKQKGSENLLFIDITSPNFDPIKEGLDPLRVHQVMHVRTSDGQIKTGVDAFIVIWKNLPKYHWLSRWAQKSLVRPILNMGYLAFAFVRPYLPRKSRECEKSPYCDTQRKP